MNNDEQFAENLRTQVTRVAPKFDVDVTRVVPAARRRRAARVGGVTLAMGLVLGGGAWAATSTAPPSALPGGSMTMEVEPSPKPSGPPERSSEGDKLMEAADPIENPIIPPEGWRDATYFHVVSHGGVTKQGEKSDDHASSGTERWYGDGLSFQLTGSGPALLDWGSYLGLEGADPISIGWGEIAALPTEPGALYDALLERFEPTGMGEDATLDNTARLVADSPAPPAVRAAGWELLTSHSDVTVQQDVEDSEGRTGTAATFVLWDRTTTVIYDEEENHPLELEQSIGKIHEVDTYFTTEFTTLPDEVAESVIEIPDFVAMTQEDAEIACLQEHLACTFEDTESDTVPEGTVISSDPAAGALVTWGAPVKILLSTGS